MIETFTGGKHMEIKEIMELSDGEKEELRKLLEGFLKTKNTPEDVVGYINKMLTDAFNTGRKYASKK